MKIIFPVVFGVLSLTLAPVSLIAGVKAEEFVRLDNDFVPRGNCYVQQTKVLTQPVNISKTPNGHRVREVGGLVTYYAEFEACTDPLSYTGLEDVKQLLKIAKKNRWYVLRSQLPLLRREGLKMVKAYPVPHAKGVLFEVEPIRPR